MKVDVNGVGIVATLKPGQFFGERALLTAEKRNASCIADGENVICLSLEKRHFENLLGDLKGVLEVCVCVYSPLNKTTQKNKTQEISKTRECEHGDSNTDTTQESNEQDDDAVKEKVKDKGEPVRRLPWAEDIKEFEIMRTVRSSVFENNRNNFNIKNRSEVVRSV